MYAPIKVCKKKGRVGGHIKGREHKILVRPAKKCEQTDMPDGSARFAIPNPIILPINVSYDP